MKKIAHIHAFRDKSILITGGAGFIGSHIMERLAAKNHVTIYDNFSRNSIKYCTNLQNVRIAKGNILSKSKLKRAVKDVGIIFHFAAIAGIHTVTKSPLMTMQVNLIGTHNLLEAVNKSESVERMIYSSTSEVYGPHVFLGSELDRTTQGPINEPRWAYATSKLAAEHLVRSHFLENNLPVVILRYFNIYGPRQTGEGAVHNFVVNAIKTKPLIVYGDGLEVRSWCYIDDAVVGTLLSASTPKAIGQAINIGNPETATTVTTLAKTIIQILGSKSRILLVRKRFTDVELQIPDITLAMKTLGYRPQVDLLDGITKTGEWYRQYPEAP
jgi:dTDP-glucose 4,6-dehydratase